MLYAVDAYPMYQQVAYEVAPAVLERSAKGSAALDARSGARSSGRITDARIHCIISSAGQAVAVCDNATLISLSDGGRARTVTADSAPRAMAASMVDFVMPTADAAVPGESPAPQAVSPTQRWLADLLMTFGVGFLLVSSFLFVTSRNPLPSGHRP